MGEVKREGERRGGQGKKEMCEERREGKGREGKGRGRKKRRGENTICKKS